MSFSFNLAAMGAAADNANKKLTGTSQAQLDWLKGPAGQAYGTTNPQQNPNWQVINDRKFDIQNLEGMALNELFDVRHGPGADTFRSLQRVGKDREKRAAEARADAGKSADVAEGVFERRTRGFGLTDRQRMGAKQSFSLNRAVTMAAAGTDARRTSLDSERAADNAVAASDDMMFGQQLSGLTSLATAEGSRRQRVAGEEAAKDANRNSFLGTLGGLGIAAFAAFSAEEYKDKTEEKPRLLDKLKDVRIDKWRYKGSKAEHIGPYAEEFNDTFGVGQFKDAIDVMSLLGVTLGSIKELNEKVEALG